MKGMRIIAHYVICPYCQERFDRDKVDYIQIGRRYAHTSCHENHQKELSGIEKDKIALENYIKKLLGIEIITPKVKRQIQEYLEKYNYTYSGILKALIYFYEVKGNDTSKANGGIGIVGYIYQEAWNYYYALWLANTQNEGKDISKYKPNEVVVRITPPKRESRRRKLFSFLDKEE